MSSSAHLPHVSSHGHSHSPDHESLADTAARHVAPSGNARMVAALESHVASLEGQIAGMQTELTSMKALLENLRGNI